LNTTLNKNVTKPTRLYSDKNWNR